MRTHRELMEKSNVRNCRNYFWFVIFASSVFWLFFFYFHSSDIIKGMNRFTSSTNEYAYSVVSREPNSLLLKENSIEASTRLSLIDNGVQPVNRLPVTEKEAEPFNETIFAENENELGNSPSVTEKGIESDNEIPIMENREDACSGRYIYVHNIPNQFNYDMLKNCSSLSEWTDMCRFVSNSGLGPPLVNSKRVFSGTGWFRTNQFALEVIFHNRMKQYRCLTNNSSMASAIYVPFYAGLDVGRYLWGFNTSMRDSASLELAKWLGARHEWKVMAGRDHFLVAGRISWDFRRLTDDNSDWGNKFMLSPEAKNMSVLVIESSPWSSNDFAIPYPTYFHPSRDCEVFQWQNRMRRQKRPLLFSFAGAPRPSLNRSIRGQIIDQCQASGRKCKLLKCDTDENKCHNPYSVMKMFQSSVFCLQPPGDSYTRRSAFDSILAGCIPVFFHPGSAYVQYIWHLPQNYTKYSVFVPEEGIRKGKVSIKKLLLRISKEEVKAMREEVISLIPRIIYADPSSRLEILEDAFDLAVQGVIEKVNSVRREIRERGNYSVGYAEENSWKYNLFGTEGEHEWDPFFSVPKDSNS
ncbi:hypothetical protein HHK36_019070 [Tetracentron sinense]|uniref:Exostosin GT47 domain-containing protein n=1 Tax=Tetracentron sinense TaxID=13715 RepID=A0A834YTD6_TETSI|nr:hypothetical protein HHK36_019070 [Tetracentron sinense]